MFVFFVIGYFFSCGGVISSQEEYDEMESEEDRVMMSLNEVVYFLVNLLCYQIIVCWVIDIDIDSDDDENVIVFGCLLDVFVFRLQLNVFLYLLLYLIYCYLISLVFFYYLF